MLGAVREHIIKRLTRSKFWPKVRKSHLKKFPYCANCGKKRKTGMQVHHIKPFHLFPELELDENNLITLCDNPRCHLDKGHLGHWKSFNENVVTDCLKWNLKYKSRP